MKNNVIWKCNITENKYIWLKFVLDQCKNPSCLVCFTPNNSTGKMNGEIWLVSNLLWCQIGTMYNFSFILKNKVADVKVYHCMHFQMNSVSFEFKLNVSPTVTLWVKILFSGCFIVWFSHNSLLKPKSTSCITLPYLELVVWQNRKHTIKIC